MFWDFYVSLIFKSLAPKFKPHNKNTGKQQTSNTLKPRNSIKSFQSQKHIHPLSPPISTVSHDKYTHRKNSNINPTTTHNLKSNQPRIWKPKKIQLLPPRDWTVNRNVEKQRISWLKHHSWNVRMIKHQTYRKKSLRKLQHATENVQAELEYRNIVQSGLSLDNPDPLCKRDNLCNYTHSIK